MAMISFTRVRDTKAQIMIPASECLLLDIGGDTVFLHGTEEDLRGFAEKIVAALPSMNIPEVVR